MTSLKFRGYIILTGFCLATLLKEDNQRQEFCQNVNILGLERIDHHLTCKPPQHHLWHFKNPRQPSDHLLDTKHSCQPRRRTEKKILSSKRRRTSQRPGFKFLRVLTSTLLGEIVLPFLSFLQDECQISLFVDYMKFAKYHGCMCLCICACVSVCMFVCLGVCATCLCMPTASSKSSSNFHDRQCNYSCGFCFHTAKTSFLLPIEVFIFFFSTR